MGFTQCRHKPKNIMTYHNFMGFKRSSFPNGSCLLHGIPPGTPWNRAPLFRVSPSLRNRMRQRKRRCHSKKVVLMGTWTIIWRLPKCWYPKSSKSLGLDHFSLAGDEHPSIHLYRLCSIDLTLCLYIIIFI